MSKQEEQYLFDIERELLGIDEWLPLFWHDELLGNITTLCGVDIVEGKPPVDERLILNSGLPIKEQKWRREFCGGGVNWVSGNTYKSKVQSLNNLVIRAYHNHDDDELWDKLIALARRERERITHGVWVYIRGVPTFLPPNYYFTLTYIPNKEGKDIEYIDSDRLSYLFSWWHIVTGRRGVFYLKRRQSGKSIELGANLLWLSCLVGDENFALQSMNDEKLRVLYSTCFQRPFESLPLMMKRGHKNLEITNGIEFGAPPSRVLGFEKAGGGDMQKALTVLNFQTPSSLMTEFPEGYITKVGKDKLGSDSLTLFFLGVDEFGKLKDVDILARHLVSLKAAKYMHYCTTIESMSDAQIEVMMNFWEQSNCLMAYQNENKETPTKLSRLFISSIFGYIDATTRGTSKEIRFVDEYGTSMIEDAYKYLVANRAATSKLGASYLLEEIRKVPMLADEVFIPDISTGALNNDLIQGRKTKLTAALAKGDASVIDVISTGEVLETPIGYKVNLIWEGNVPFTKVVAVPSQDGDFVMVYPPRNPNAVSYRERRRFNSYTQKEESYIEYSPLNVAGRENGHLYGGGADPYAFDESNRQGSKGGITILDNDRTDAKGYRPVLYYCKRTGKTDDFYNKVLMACWFYGCTAVWDKKSEDAKRFYFNLGCEAFMESKKISAPDKRVSVAIAESKGENTTSPKLVEYTNLLDTYINGYCDRINIMDLLTQLSKWRLGKNKTTNYLDGAFSFALALYNCLVPAYITTIEVGGEDIWGLVEGQEDIVTAEESEFIWDSVLRRWVRDEERSRKKVNMNKIKELQEGASLKKMDKK